VPVLGEEAAPQPIEQRRFRVALDLDLELVLLVGDWEPAPVVVVPPPAVILGVVARTAGRSALVSSGHALHLSHRAGIGLMRPVPGQCTQGKDPRAAVVPPGPPDP
jgi:hypothetical protein